MKNSKSNKINIIFSSFLVIGYIVCTYFFSTMASTVSGTLGQIIQILMLVIFGLLLFFATRVGEGRQVRRFSLAVLLMVVLPTLYIVIASLIEGMPFHDAVAPEAQAGAFGAPSVILAMASIALGYGIPYTFFSGYEMKEDDEAAAEAEETEKKVLEGGLAEELAETEAAEEAIDTADEAVEEVTDNAAKADEEAAEAE